MKERFRVRSIPPRITLDAIRIQEGRSGSVGIGRLSSKEPRQRSLEQNSKKA